MQSKNVKNILSSVFMLSFVSFLFMVKHFDSNVKNTDAKQTPQKFQTAITDFSNDNKYGLFLSSSHADMVSDFDYLYKFYNSATQQTGEDFLGKSFIIKSFSLPEAEVEQQALAELKKDKTSILANVYLSHLYFKKGDYKKAYSYLTGMKEKSENVLIKLLKAWTLTAQEKYDDAMDLLETEIQNRAFRKLVLTHLAAIAELSGDDEYANELYGIVLQTEKPNIFDLENIAAFYERVGDKFSSKESKNKSTKDSKSLPKYIQVINDYNEKYPDSLSNYSLLNYVKSGIYKPQSIKNANQGYAKALFDTASILSLLFASANDLQLFYYNMVSNLYPDFYMSTLIKNEVIKNFDKKIFPSDKQINEIPEKHYLYITGELSKISSLLQNPKTKSAGLDAFESLVKKYPNVPQLYYRLGKYYEGVHNYKNAIDYYTKALSLTENKLLSSEILFSRAQNYDALNNKKSTISDLEQAFSNNPNNPLLLNYYGYYLVNKDIDIEKGISLIGKAVSASPTNPYFLDSYGWGLYKNGNIEKALSILEAAKSLQPRNPIFYDHLADVYWRAGRTREAVYEWKKALQHKSSLQSEVSSEVLDVEKIEYKISHGL